MTTSREQLNALPAFPLTAFADAIMIGCDRTLDRHVVVSGRMRFKHLQFGGTKITATCPHCGKVVTT